ncbi:MAG: flippase [Bacteroidia bacterium]|nr:flippase [Bacteroidia bacterium]
MRSQPPARKDILFLLKKSGIALTVKAGGMITQYLFIFTVARLLGPGILGTFTLSFTVLQLVSILALMGLDNLLIRKVAAARVAGDQAGLKSIYQTSAGITALSSILLALLLYLAAPLLAQHVFSKPWLTEHFRLISLALPPFVWITLHAAAFRGSKNMLGFTLFKTVIPLLNALFILISWYSGFPFTPVMGFATSTIIVAVFYVLTWRKFSGLAGSPSVPSVHRAELIRESLPMMITGSIFFILNWIDNLVIGIYRTEAEVGFYDTAFKISSASAAVLMAVNAIQAPTFAEIHSKQDHKRLRNYVFNSTRILFYATAPITFALLLFPELILSIFGKDFSVSARSLQILAIGNFFNCITGSVGILLMMTGYQRQYNRIIVLAAIIGISLNFLLVPILGIEGAAISSTASKIFWNLISVIYVYRKLGITSIYLPGMRRPGNEQQGGDNTTNHSG